MTASLVCIIALLLFSTVAAVATVVVVVLLLESNPNDFDVVISAFDLSVLRPLGVNALTSALYLVGELAVKKCSFNAGSPKDRLICKAPLT